MPLEVTAGPQVAAPGSGPPGMAGVGETGPPTGDPGVPFAALLAQQTQPALPALVAQAKPSDPVPAKTTGKSTAKDDDTDPADRQTAPAQANSDQMIADWAALAAQQMPQTSLAQTQTNSPPTEDTPVRTAPTLSTEVMDTVSPSAPLAVPAKTETASSELLPPSTISQTPSAAPQAVPGTTAGTPAPAVSQTTVPVIQTVPQPVPSVPTVTSASASLLTETTALPTLLGKAVDPQPPAAPSAPPVQPTQEDVVSPDVSTSVPAAVQPLPTAPANAPLPVPLAVQPPAATPPPVAASRAILVLPAAVSAQSPVQAAVLPTASSLTPSAINQNGTIPIVAPVQIALQNLAVPANNTGKSDAPRPAVTPSKPVESSQFIDSGSFTEEGQTGIVPPKRFAAAAVVMEQGAAVAQGKTARSAGQTASDDQDEPALQDVSKPLDDSTDIAALLPQSIVVTDNSNGQVASTASTEKPLTGAERAQVIRQAADSVSAIKPQVLAGGQGQMTLQLHPKEWGDLRVTVHLAVAQPVDGMKQTAVVAHVVASSPAVKSALETHSADLSHALRETGLRLDRLTVTVQAPDASGKSGSATSDSQSFSQRNQDQSQSTSSQSGTGGSPSSFASFSERQGGRQFTTQTASPPGHVHGDEGEMSAYPVSNYTTRQSGGFDGRA